ncbi:MAG: Uma2 family endonuclease [Betaproteobacteria bacterium]|nr:Uma2 family endonuclease [Betaproteobacteria bacterium]
MRLPAERPARYEDLFDLPANLVGEIINGRLVTHPRPAPRHAHAYSSLGGELVGPFDKARGGPGGWWILDEPEIHIGADILVPDLAGWCRSRMPHLPQTAWFDLAPDWVCEILSPSTARDDRVEKLPIYGRWGVGHAWLVDPDLRILEAYENALQRWTLIATLKDDDEVRLAPFDAIGFPLAGLWAE